MLVLGLFKTQYQLTVAAVKGCIQPQQSATICPMSSPQTLAALKQAVSLLGGISGAARQCGTSRQAVEKWIRENRIPADRAVQLMFMTEGAVTVDRLRPDLYGPRILRFLAAQRMAS